MSVSLIITVGLTIVILAVAAGLMARNRSVRALVMGIGLAAIPVGLYLTGVTDLTINGIGSLIAWFQRTPFTTLTAWGIGLAVGGLVIAVIGTFLPKGTRTATEPNGAPRVERSPRTASPQPSVAQGRQGQPTAAPAASKADQPSPAPKTAPANGKQAQKGLDPEDAEIEALLRKRGIM